MADDIHLKFLDIIHDESLIHYFYIDSERIEDLLKKLRTLKFHDIGKDADVPFMAKIRGYTGATDQEGHHWLLKEVTDLEEVMLHKLEEIAYCLDFMMDTLAAPTILFKQDGKFYRAIKVIPNAMQIGSYNYLEPPFKRILLNDLINRWLFFDEDRNPNNYLVVHNSKNTPLVVVIDYNKADLLTETMKISGDPDKFGWFREEKTRFLTLLRPSNFENLSIDTFERRLTKMMNISKEDLLKICHSVLENDVENHAVITEKVVNNFMTRREYINNYFRQWFVKQDISFEAEQDSRYGGMGQAFLNAYKKKI